MSSAEPKHKKKKKRSPSPSASSSPSVDESSDHEEKQVPQELPVQAVTPLAKQKKKPKEKVLLQTSDPLVNVEVRSRVKGPKKRKIVVYREDLPRDEITIVEKSHKKGRPSSNFQIKMQEPEVKDDVLVFPRPSTEKPITAKQLKHIEIMKHLAEMEQAAGRKLRQTKKGGVDKRCIMDRTPKQIASAQALVRINAERRLVNAHKEKQALHDTVKTAVMEAQKPQAKQPQPRSLESVRTRDLFRNEDSD